MKATSGGAVEPGAVVLAWAAAKYEPGLRHLNRVIGMAESIAKTKIPLDALHSTIGRHAARAVVCGSMVENLQQQWQLLVDNIASGDSLSYNVETGQLEGTGFTASATGK